MLYGLVGLVYPEICVTCQRALFKGEQCICTRCRTKLPKTNYHTEPGNKVEKKFWGRIPLHAASAYLYFSKGEKVQRLMHQLKYQGRQDVGFTVGQWFAYDLLQSERFKNLDMLLPVPLHKLKLKKRGYNQSDCIANGMASVLSIPCYPDLLYRIEATESQTKKHRYERFENVNRVFGVTDGNILNGKNVLLVDDVITTGSTLISLAETVYDFNPASISIAAMATA